MWCLICVETDSLRISRDRMVDLSLNTCYTVINNHGYYYIPNKVSDIVLTRTELLRSGST